MRHTRDGLPLRKPHPHRRAAHVAVTNADVDQAQTVYDQHVPTMTELRHCIAPGCGTWPCQPYRDAELVLRAAGRLPVTWTPASAPTPEAI
ncbi:MAG: hypothetical protein ACRDT8_03120 [Micromonosporaceae bacterium]